MREMSVAGKLPEVANPGKPFLSRSAAAATPSSALFKGLA